MSVERRIRKAIARIAECKAELICANGHLVTRAVNINLNAREAMLQTMNEIRRVDNDLPRCPPDCEKDNDEVLVIGKDVDIEVTEVL